MNNPEATSKTETAPTCCDITDWQGSASRFFKALAEPNRVSILSRLAAACGPQTVGDVADCCTIDMSVVSRHLATLREAGIVVAEKRGRKVHYSVRYEEVVRTLRVLADAIEDCCVSPASTCCPPSADAETIKETS